MLLVTFKPRIEAEKLQRVITQTITVTKRL